MKQLLRLVLDIQKTTKSKKNANYSGGGGGGGGHAPDPSRSCTPTHDPALSREDD